MFFMKRSPEASKPRRNLKARLAVGAISMAAVLGGGDSAQANKEATVSNAYLPMQPMSALRKQTEQLANHHQPIEVYNGTLSFHERRQDPRTKRWQNVPVNIAHPLVVYRGDLKAESHRDPPWSGDYDLGSVTNKMGHAVVNLMRYNPTMTFTPDVRKPRVIEGILGGGPGSLEFNQLSGERGTPTLLDPDGHPELVAYEYTPNK
jgi:hypothetical protein